jgi:mono/diheme cytochrome c family protein
MDCGAGILPAPQRQNFRVGACPNRPNFGSNAELPTVAPRPYHSGIGLLTLGHDWGVDEMKPVTAVLTALALALIGAPASLANDAAETVTFTRDVAPILQENCQGCHRPGQIGPMPLLNYEEARPWAKAIQQQVVKRSMPPWFAHPDSRAMKGDLNLTDDEIATISDWVDQGATRGNPADLPEPRVFEAYEGGWQLGEPDIVLRYPVPNPVGKEVDDEYRCFPIEFGLDHDVWLKGVEFKPGNNKVVHHFILFDDTTGVIPRMDEETPEPGCECGQMDSALAGSDILQMWAPGNVQPLPAEGIGKRIKKGANLVLQIHYHNVTGADAIDHSEFALHLAKPDETIMKEMRGQLVSQWVLDIKAGDANSEHQAKWVANQDITAYSTGVHMHYRGKDMGLWATTPAGEEETLIWVPNYDFNWQLTYEFVEPFNAPKGTEFVMVSHHDNSENNPHNPVIPPVDVKWGLATSDEMAFSGISYTIDDEALNITPQYPSEEVIARLEGGSSDTQAGD